MNKFKNFNKLVKFEFVRLFRNRVVFFCLIFFAILVVCLTATPKDSYDIPIAVFTSGKDISQVSAMSVMKDSFNEEKFIYVSSIEEGKDAVKYGKAIMFIEVNAETTPESLIMYFDSSSNASVILQGSLNNEKNKYSYDTIKQFLEDYGITINQSYFETVSFVSISETNNSITSGLFVLGMMAGVSVVIMFGLAYSISRDNETSVNKILSYMPIKSHTFLFSKIVPYLVIATIEMIILILLGILLFNISFQMNIFIILLLSIVFILSTICLGLVFSSFKSQITTALCSVAVILIPMLLLSASIIQTFPLFVQIILYAMPMTPCIQLLHGMIFNGIVNWIYVLMLLVQIVIYYLLAYFLLRKNIKNI